MTKSLFHSFQEISSKEWKQKIQFDLKGADYNDTLVWNSLEGIDVKPFYHRDEFKHEPFQIPGHPSDWKITQEVFVDDEKIANHLAVDAIRRGAEAIVFTSKKEFDSNLLFLDFPFSEIPIHFHLSFLSELFIEGLKQFLSKNRATVFYHIDPIGRLTKDGNWFHNLKQDHEMIEKIIGANPEDNNLSVDMAIYQNAGATMVQQLAYGLAHANEYLNHFNSKTKSQALQKGQLTFRVSVGTNYFFEIAKLRALRLLYSTLAKEYDIPETCFILTQPTRRNKTLYDYNVNLLRTTTEYMSAVLGGADAVCSSAYDAIYHKSNEFGERIARNQLLIIKSESYFDSNKNPAEGSYYIESLTHQLAEKALVLFKEIESNRGFLTQLKEGVIQKKIKESASKEQSLFDSGKINLLGTNKHSNPEDKMKENMELYPFLKFNPRKTLVEPIIEKRLSEKLEQERINNE